MNPSLTFKETLTHTVSKVSSKHSVTESPLLCSTVWFESVLTQEDPDYFSLGNQYLNVHAFLFKISV